MELDARADARSFASALTVLFFFAFLALPGSAAIAQTEPTLRVFAAASLTEVVEALAQHFEGARVETSFGSSSALARQIRDGAPADVFVSASPEWIDDLREAGALAGEPIMLARNRLVCIASKGSPLEQRRVSGPSALLDALGPDGRVAIADEGVPAGEYARAALAKLGLQDAYRSHLVGQRDVRAVLHVVERGELPAGFVYGTDAKIADVVVLFAFDPATHPAIEYQAAVLREASHPEQARRFLEYLRSATARTLLTNAGFARP
jgi:molybdate transport system substrate-binding protein